MKRLWKLFEEYVKRHVHLLDVDISFLICLRLTYIYFNCLTKIVANTCIFILAVCISL